MAKAATERAPKVCSKCEGWGFDRSRQLPGPNPAQSPMSGGPMVFCECVKPTDHSRYRHSRPVTGNTRLTEGKVRLPSDKRKETLDHNRRLKAEREAAEAKSKGGRGGFQGR